MNDLTDLCGVTQSELDGLDLDQLRETCIDVGATLSPSGGGIGLVLLLAAAGAALVLLVRVIRREPADSVVGTTIEGALYGGLGAYAGLVAGVVVADFMPPLVAGLLFSILAGVVLLLMIVAMIRGDGDVGWKLLGFLQALVLAGGLAALAWAAFSATGDGPAADSYSRYINAVSVGLALAGGVNGALVALARAAHWSVGWLLVPLNASWGFIGNILGLLTHIASFNAYADHGTLKKTRLFYAHYEKGLSLKENSAGRFAFCQGAVLSADSAELERHEAVHALQHYIAGPIYPLSHFGWFIPLAIIGFIVGWARTDVAADEGATAYGYYNNPWEVMAYGFINPGGRDSSKPMIFDWWLAILFTVVWIVTAIVVAIKLFTSAL